MQSSPSLTRIVTKLLQVYSTRFENTIEQVKMKPEEGGDLRDALVTENLNWVNWHLQSVIFPALVEIDKIIIGNFKSLMKQEPVRKLLKLQTELISGPTIQAYIKSKYDGNLKDMPTDLKPTFDTELELKRLYTQIVDLLINSA